MTRVVVSPYSFNRNANTVTLTGLSTVVKDQIVSIVDVTRNKVLYLASDAPSASLNGKVLTLPTGAMYGVGSNDQLRIVYGFDVAPSPILTEIIGDAPSSLDTLGEVATALGLKADAAATTTALAGKASTTHTHPQSDITGLTTALSNKAATVHTHVISDITGLQSALDAKAALAHGHITITPVTNTVTLGAIAAQQYVILIGASGAPTLPTAASNTSIYHLKNVDSVSHSIATTSAQTIEGSSSYSLLAGASISVVSNGANWVII